MTPSAFDTLHLSGGDCVACIGGGGKTSTLRALAAALSARGEKVILTTTTRIHVPEGLPLVLLANGSSGMDDIGRLLVSHPAVAVGAALSDAGKVEGLSADEVRALRHLGIVLVEADGSAGRSLKVHAAHEPVIPPCSTHVLVVAGIDAVGRPVGDESVHRLPDFEQRFRVGRGAETTPRLVAEVLAAAAGRVPAGAHIIYVLNKVDSAERLAAAEAVKAELRRVVGDVPVLITVRGEPRAASPSRESSS